MPFALGLIEVTGLAAAVEALDTALKTADVTALEIENSRGSGRQTVKITGSVSAVRVAVEAGAAAAGRIGKVYAARVIARPSGELERYLRPRLPDLDRPPVPLDSEQTLSAAERAPVSAPEAGRKAESPKMEKRHPGKKRTQKQDRN